MFPGTGKSWMLTAVITACCLLSGCRHSGLSRVERLMENDIEVADSLISAMNKPTGKRGRARYALLKTQIDYKLYRPTLNENGIRIATDYYGRNRKSFHAAMAWYSLGCVSAELGRDSTAADAYLTALRLFPDTLVRYYALAQQNLSYIYLEHNMENEAIRLIKSCRTNAVRLNDSAAITFCDYNIANSLLYNNEYDSARVMFLKLKDNPWMTPGTKDVPLLQLSKIASLADSNFEKSIEYVDSFIKRNRHQLPYGAAYSLKANAYYMLNQIDSAFHYYTLSLSDTNDPYTICDTYRRLSEIHSLKGNTDSATYCSKQASSWTDSIVSASNSEDIFRALLNHSQSDTSPKSLWSSLIKIVLFSALFIIVSYLLISFNRRKIAASGNKTDNSAAEPAKDTHLEAIEDYAGDINEFKQSKLFELMVTATTKQKELSVKQKTDFINEFRNLFVRPRAHLAASYNLNDDDIDFCIYSLLGFKQKDFFILFFNPHPRMIKYRLKEKLPISLFDYIFNPETT